MCALHGSVELGEPVAVVVMLLPLDPAAGAGTGPVPQSQAQGGQVSPGAHAGQAQVQVP